MAIHPEAENRVGGMMNREGEVDGLVGFAYHMFSMLSRPF